MNALNAVLLELTSLVLAPFASLPSQVALIVLSAIAGVLAAIAFRYTSNQTALKRVANEVRASLLAMRLFKDDLRSVFGAQLSLFKASGLRLLHSLPPLLVLIVPFVLLLAQLAMWYEFRPPAVGEAVLAEVSVAAEAWEEYQGLRLLVPQNLDATTEPVRNTHAHLITWRLQALKAPGGPDPQVLRFVLGESVAAEKQFVACNGGGVNELLFVSPMRAGTNFWDRLLYPGEPAFAADSPIQKISIDYGSRANTLFGLKIHWLITFFVVSILAALAMKPFIKVQF